MLNVPKISASSLIKRRRLARLTIGLAIATLVLAATVACNSLSASAPAETAVPVDSTATRRPAGQTNVDVEADPEESSAAVQSDSDSDSERLSSPAQPGNENNADSHASASPMELLLADARHIKGDADAPVTIVEFIDFK